METIILDDDIKVMYVTATSFPDGVMAAFDKLYALISPDGSRRIFGISRPEKGVITYRATAEEMVEGEGKKMSCETLVLKHGKYQAITIHDFMKNIPAIGAAFQQILSQPGIDPDGYCVEWYLNGEDVQCMVRLSATD
jgi:hypothetical protein